MKVKRISDCIDKQDFANVFQDRKLEWDDWNASIVRIMAATWIEDILSYTTIDCEEKVNRLKNLIASMNEAIKETYPKTS